MPLLLLLMMMMTTTTMMIDDDDDDDGGGGVCGDEVRLNERRYEHDDNQRARRGLGAESATSVDLR